MTIGGSHDGTIHGNKVGVGTAPEMTVEELNWDESKYSNIEKASDLACRLRELRTFYLICLVTPSGQVVPMPGRCMGTKSPILRRPQAIPHRPRLREIREGTGRPSGQCCRRDGPGIARGQMKDINKAVVPLKSLNRAGLSEIALGHIHTFAYMCDALSPGVEPRAFRAGVPQG